MAEYIFKGSLNDNPLPEILQKIYYYKVPGVLTVTGNGGSKQIFISGGEVIFASSTFPEDRLGEFLLSKGIIDQAQYDLSVEIMKRTGKRQGTALVEAGVLTPQALYQAVKDQVLAIVLSLFGWTEGEVTFRVGKYKDDEIIKLNLDTRNAILQGIYSIQDPKRIVKWLGRKEDVFEPTDHALSVLPTLPLSADDKRVFRLVDGVRSFLGILQASTQDATATAKTLYALNILGLVRKKNTAIRIVAPGTPCEPGKL
jgi:hypothetical protein